MVRKTMTLMALTLSLAMFAGFTNSANANTTITITNNALIGFMFETVDIAGDATSQNIAVGQTITVTIPLGFAGIFLNGIYFAAPTTGCVNVGTSPSNFCNLGGCNYSFF